MNNEAYDVIVHDSPAYKANGQFLEVSKATVEYPNGFSFTFEVELIGTWTFKSNIIDIKFEQSTFLSSNSPEINKQKGQKIADDQLVKKNWAKNEVISLGEKLQFKAVDPMHKEANVLITCKKA
ncbi:hypothetical protein TUM4445_26660 [Shewanella sp. MBTL60-112-B2]|nr:hypothetical protein TUM4444_19620 [Shewanella sp. MBTL60-112-B1]GIU36069.1 hypothetical protein TUM4445_26660 [Shewanella sp. MBTL60-112-B2]